jgi:hypothetical protein
MGQEIAKSYTPPPLTLHNCLVDGQIDLGYMQDFNMKMNMILFFHQIQKKENMLKLYPCQREFK